MESYEKQEGSPMEYDKKAQVIENNSPIREENQSKSPIRDKVGKNRKIFLNKF